MRKGFICNNQYRKPAPRPCSNHTALGALGCTTIAPTKATSNIIRIQVERSPSLYGGAANRGFPEALECLIRSKKPTEGGPLAYKSWSTPTLLSSSAKSTTTLSSSLPGWAQLRHQQRSSQPRKLDATQTMHARNSRPTPGANDGRSLVFVDQSWCGRRRARTCT